MHDDKAMTVAPLKLADAHELAPLLAAYAQDQQRGAPRRPDEYYAEIMCDDRTAEVLGVRADGRLIGFAVFHDLRDTMSGLRVGQLDDLFVIQDARGRGAGMRLVEAVLEIGREREWGHVRWMTPDRPETASRLADKMAARRRWSAYLLPVERRSPDGD